MSTSTQMLKGILEGCLLAVIARGETYGYEMIEKLEQFGFHMVSEGSIYPVLIRLQKEGLVSTVMKASPNGPKRKYYSITPAGLEDLTDFQARWKELSRAVEALFDIDLTQGGDC
ncbi:PadR family transcriptional regulator [Paenibacillus sp. J2TS4]|uniref:PadR family transcriptional regulator n=1 Tax=Paenibacillus sp. J2TS4 TaxID=2807194 RepID=UPI001B0D46A9|nr:PadR family transcriptional regulator [Paenibacillus sp. J2TS4]GIP34813.1 PadR family transcriptional regulator [Paenibacillus sp. J2TS4]